MLDLCRSLSWFRPEHFITGGRVIMDSYFSLDQWFEVKNVLMDLFQLLSSPDVNWWTGVVWITCGLLWCFYQLFGLSFWRHPFTAEHPLVSRWWNATFLQIWWKKFNYILDGLSVSTFHQFLISGWTKKAFVSCLLIMFWVFPLSTLVIVFLHEKAPFWRYRTFS